MYFEQAFNSWHVTWILKINDGLTDWKEPRHVLGMNTCTLPNMTSNISNMTKNTITVSPGDLGGRLART